MTMQDPTDLFAVAKTGKFEEIMKAIDSGADPLMTNKDGMTALEVAKESGKLNDKQMKDLVELANSKLVIRDFKDPKQYEIIKDYAKVTHVDEIIDFHEQIEALAKKSSIMSDRELIDVTAKLMNAFIFDKDEKQVALNLDGQGTEQIIVDSRDKLRTYGSLDKGVDKGNLDRAKCLEIIKTCSKLDEDYARFLLKQGGQIPNQVSRAIVVNRNPFHAYIENQKNYKEGQQSEKNLVWGVIKRQAADINQKNPEGITPLQLAVMKGNKELVTRMLNTGADPSITTTNYKRGFLTAVGDFFRNGSTKNPPRTAGEIAKLAGFKEIAKDIAKVEENPIISPVKKDAAKKQVEDVDKPSTRPTTAPPTDLPPPLPLAPTAEKPPTPPVIPPELPSHVLEELLKEEESHVDLSDDVLKTTSVKPPLQMRAKPLALEPENFAKEWKQLIGEQLSENKDIKVKSALRRVLELLNSSEVDSNDKSAVVKHFNEKGGNIAMLSEKAKEIVGPIVEAIKKGDLPPSKPKENVAQEIQDKSSSSKRMS